MYTVFNFILIWTITAGQIQDSCKNPDVAKRTLADDARFASPFYMIALPRTPRTEFIDNICYTYFENGSGGFNHVMSVTFKDGNYQYHRFSKGDIADRIGLAEAISQGKSTCNFHDYTLHPVCNSTVFILYRCFIDGSCSDIDIGRTPGVDVRVVLAANPIVSPECKKETEKSLRDTSFFSGGNYIVLPQKLKPKCITKYNDEISIGNKRAVGSIEIKDVESSDRLAEEGFNTMSLDTTTKQFQNGSYSFNQQSQAAWTNSNVPARNPTVNAPYPPPPKQSFNPYGINLPKGTSSSTASSQSYSTSNFQGGNFNNGYNNGKPGQTPAQNWNQNNGQWNAGPNPWTGQNHQGETHHHMWQQPNAANNKVNNNNNNVYYHVHRWESPPPGCCKCN